MEWRRANSKSTAMLKLRNGGHKLQVLIKFSRALI
jgi:hypothetical protein